MAQGSNCTLHIQTEKVLYHKEAWEFADMGFIPAGAYRNREYAQQGVLVKDNISRTMQDILYDPQTSGGLLISVPEKEGMALFAELQAQIPNVAIVGYVTQKEDNWIYLEK